jgi:hypothetical protein
LDDVSNETHNVYALPGHEEECDHLGASVYEAWIENVMYDANRMEIEAPPLRRKILVCERCGRDIDPSAVAEISNDLRVIRLVETAPEPPKAKWRPTPDDLGRAPKRPRNWAPNLRHPWRRGGPASGGS